MPRCSQCQSILPPDLVQETGFGTHKCVFCSTGKNYIMVMDSVTNSPAELTKDFAIEDYANYIAKIKERYESKGINAAVDEMRTRIG